MLNFRLSAPACWSTSTSSPGSRASSSPAAHVRVGALCPQRELERHAEALAACPLLALALPYVGHVATRNRGTVGGSIAHADAAAELPLLLQTLAGDVEVTGQSGARFVPAEEFFVSHLTSCLEPDEIVDGGALPRDRRRMGVGLRRGGAAPWRLRRLRRRVCAARCGRRRRGGQARRRRGLRPAGAAPGCRARPGGLPLRARGARRGGGRGARRGRSERRHARLGRVPPAPDRRARRAAAAQRAYAMAAR